MCLYIIIKSFPASRLVLQQNIYDKQFILDEEKFILQSIFLFLVLYVVTKVQNFKINISFANVFIEKNKTYCMIHLENDPFKIWLSTNSITQISKGREVYAFGGYLSNSKD